ncbi:MAG TPA: single-stranded-DNA-specific exonuclease RecJ [Verrucomicrobiae bacterium]|nr:single-stranded-DNA-specific exonuclease RecJ [Verrucomicrobiae bacterium]
MKAARFRWSFAPPQPLFFERLASELKISPLLARCLVNRGLSLPAAASEFLEPRLKRLSDPFLLPNMATAVERLFLARNRSERLVIFGDYDVDGVTSTALLSEALGVLGWNVAQYLPHRFDEGYGLSQDGVEHCLQRFPSTLLLAVDCGSTAVATIDWLRQRGVDVIVLDHHQVADPPPAAVALVNPQLNTRESGAETVSEGGTPLGPFCELCSAGLAFKLVHALVKRGRQLELPEAMQFDLRPFLDLVALGTIADLVPLRGENRILVAAGLERLDTTQRIGLCALKTVAGINRAIGVYEVGFQLAPRLNAAGRLETAAEALDLLRAVDSADAQRLARDLDARNRQRQEIERNIAEEVIGAVRAKFNPETDYVIVEGQLLWHIGVVGIVASRVLREFYRPSIIIGGEGNEWRGSGRSIEGFDLAEALRGCDNLLLRHGGHAMAAGLSIRPENLAALRDRLNELARTKLRPEQLQPVLRLDADVSFKELTVEAIEELHRLEPVGQGNPPVQFVSRNVVLQRPPQRMGRDQQHAKLWATEGSVTHEVVCWNCEDAVLPTGRFDLAYAPQINEYSGRSSVQLKLLDWRSA